MCLNETYNRIRVCKHTRMFDMFSNKNGLKQTDALSPLLFNFAVKYATNEASCRQGGLEIK